MAADSDAFDGCCPSCGHTFTLADLKRMAVGDGWQRYIIAQLQDGTKKVVAFDDFDPRTMIASYEARAHGAQAIELPGKL